MTEAVVSAKKEIQDVQGNVGKNLSTVTILPPRTFSAAESRRPEMTLSCAFYKATSSISHGISTYFNWASGEKSLKDRNLKREKFEDGIQGMLGLALGCTAFVVAGNAVFPVAGVLGTIFSGVVAGGVVSPIPFGLQAVYIIGKEENKRNSALKR